MSSPIIFRLYPEEDSRLFVRALVHPTRAAMRDHWRRRVRCGFNGGSWGRRLAYCTEIRRWTVARRGAPAVRDRCVAEVHMFRSRIGMEIVAHEFLHATEAWGRRVQFVWSRLGDDDAVNQDEERLAYVHGRIVRQFVARAYSAGLY